MNDFIRDLENKLHEDFGNLHSEIDLSRAVGSEIPFTIQAQATERETCEKVAELLMSLLKDYTLTSPVESVVYSVKREEDQAGIVLADQFGLKVELPPEMVKNLKILVSPGQSVHPGTPLIEFSEQQLEAATFYVIAMLQTPSYEDETESNLHMFGPFKAVALEE
jgi:hypothetical protein